MNTYLHQRSQNIYAPGSAASGTGGTTGVDTSITTLAQLAAIPTVNLTPPVIKIWVQASDGLAQTWQLRVSTAATDPGSVQRPTDYNASTNAKVWFKAGT